MDVLAGCKYVCDLIGQTSKIGEQADEGRAVIPRCHWYYSPVIHRGSLVDTVV